MNIWIYPHQKIYMNEYPNIFVILIWHERMSKWIFALITRPGLRGKGEQQRSFPSCQPIGQHSHQRRSLKVISLMLCVQTDDDFVICGLLTWCSNDKSIDGSESQWWGKQLQHVAAAWQTLALLSLLSLLSSLSMSFPSLPSPSPSQLSSSSSSLSPSP